MRVPASKKVDRQTAAGAPAVQAAPAAAGFPVVAVGCSAGGLEALTSLLGAWPAGSGMAIILLQHLDPTHASMMVDLLSAHTAMPVAEAGQGMPLSPDHIYVIPPGRYLSVRKGALRLSTPPAGARIRAPFDHLLQSLADEFGPRSGCVILSGTGSDGSAGAQAVKAGGGFVVAQDPEEAAYDGMPSSAVASGAVDLVLPVDEIPEALRRHWSRAPSLPQAAAAASLAGVALAGIVAQLRASTAQDFASYKDGTLRRRIERRMSLAGITSSERYRQLLREDSQELERLAKDLLINVTHFFRDEAAFAVLAKKVVPEIVRLAPPDRPIRAWVPGCSSGEEPYSIAMLFLEEMAAVKITRRLQIFATDLDDDAIATARAGLYPDSTAAEVGRERLARFFVKEDHGYRIMRQVREAVIFSTHDVLNDAPFSRLDLVSCRNLLIYLQPDAQQKVLSLFHFALRNGGFLFLGSVEGVGGAGDRFEAVSKRYRIYRHIRASRPGEVEVLPGRGGIERLVSHRAPPPGGVPRGSVADLTRQALLDTYAPASVLVSRDHEGLFYSGATDRYLSLPQGEPSHDLLATARPGLRGKLRIALQRAAASGEPVTVTGGRVQRDGAATPVIVGARPISLAGDSYLLVHFIDAPAGIEAPLPAADLADGPRIAELEQALAERERELTEAERERDIAVADRYVIDEEALSITEEFQTTNEELETSKEELQSLNEELTTLNAQLQETAEQQRATANDLQNILNSSDIATLFLDQQLNIRFFTPAAKPLFSLIPSDIGRPLADLAQHFADANLQADARLVLSSLAPIAREIEANSGTWYACRILPYRTQDDRIDGVVITFVDITRMKTVENDLRDARLYAENIVNTVGKPLVVLDGGLAIVSANRAFHQLIGTRSPDIVGRQLGKIGTRQLELERVRALLARLRAGEALIEEYEVEAELPPLGRRILLLNARTLREAGKGQRRILVAMEDITDRKLAATTLEAARRAAEDANLAKSRFLAAASHDLRQPLQSLGLFRGVLSMRIKNHDDLDLLDRMGETISGMAGMLNTLLDINQLEAGVVRANIVAFPIGEMLGRLQTEFSYHAQVHGLDWRVVNSSLTVRSDPRMLEEIIRNLLSNAVKYTERGKILLGCRRQGDMLSIEVWDTGLGIPEAQLQAIFEEFHQLNNPARELSRGLGLGLAIVQRLGKLMGHEVHVRSRVSKGSAFGIRVPIAPASAVGPSPASDTVEPSARRGAVLVVEDDPDVRTAMDMLLTHYGHDIMVAADGEEALRLVAKRSLAPDIAIIDYNLPGGINGLQVAARLRASLGPRLAVVMLTGDISTDTAAEVERHGYLRRSKPISAEDLRDLVAGLLRSPPVSGGGPA